MERPNSESLKQSAQIVELATEASGGHVQQSPNLNRLPDLSTPDENVLLPNEENLFDSNRLFDGKKMSVEKRQLLNFIDVKMKQYKLQQIIFERKERMSKDVITREKVRQQNAEEFAEIHELTKAELKGKTGELFGLESGYEEVPQDVKVALEKTEATLKKIADQVFESGSGSEVQPQIPWGKLEEEEKKYEFSIYHDNQLTGFSQKYIHFG